MEGRAVGDLPGKGSKIVAISLIIPVIKPFVNNFPPDSVKLI
jgi:hypothetical protein